MSARLIIAGDCCLHGRCASMSAEQLSIAIKDIKPIVQSADAALVNLETAVVTTGLKPIKKAGPALRTDARILEIIRSTGFTGVTLANNHFADFGQEGVEESMKLLDEYGLWHVGAGMDKEKAAEVGYLQAGDTKIAVINACEHEFTIAEADKAGCNHMNPVSIYRKIQESKQHADYTVVIIHGGHENYNLPSLRMQENYRFFIDAGADAVVNHHQHCYSGYEIYQGKPIVYGLGNFFFDWQGHNMDWNEGYMVQLSFGKDIEIELIPYVQNAKTVGICLLTDDERRLFDENIMSLNEIILSPQQLHQNLKEWGDRVRSEYMSILKPKEGKRIRLLERMHLIPQSCRENWMPEYMTEERRLLLKSLFQCESHQEIMNLLLQ